MADAVALGLIFRAGLRNGANYQKSAGARCPRADRHDLPAFATIIFFGDMCGRKEILLGLQTMRSWPPLAAGEYPLQSGRKPLCQKKKQYFLSSLSGARNGAAAMELIRCRRDCLKRSGRRHEHVAGAVDILLAGRYQPPMAWCAPKADARARAFTADPEEHAAAAVAQRADIDGHDIQTMA